MMVLVGCAHGDASESPLVTDFGSRSLTWITVNDEVMGGRSDGGGETENGILVFRGSTNTDGGGFSSIRTEPKPLGLDGRAAIRLRCRGDGRTYRFRLEVRGAPAPYWAEFRTVKGEWREICLPFDSFEAKRRGRPVDLPPPDPADVVGLGFMIFDRRDGPFQLEVDWIRADPPFSLDSLKWERRPLVVFAARGNDPRVARQVEAVDASRDGFEERDMALLVVTPDGGLTSVERERLRNDLRVGPDDFAVLLVGKDGGVKRRADEPVDMAEIFTLIDGMPMRQREMRSRGPEEE